MILLSIVWMCRAEVGLAQEALDTTRTYAVDAVTIIENRTGLDPAQLPFSATVLPVKLGVATRADALAAVLESVPGVFAASRSGGTDLRLTVRGFGARGNGDRSNSGTIRGIKILLDGVPLTEPDGRTSPDLLTFLQGGRVEVIRTNASTLFGNASGGVINIESSEPLNEAAWAISTTAGSFGLRKAMGRLGLTFGLTSVHVSAGSLSLDGWRQNSSVNAASCYAVATIRPSSDTWIRATLGLTRHQFGIPGALTDTEYAADPSMADPVYAARRERRDNLVGISSLQLTQALGPSNTIAASAYIGPKSLLRSERNTYREFQRWTGGGGLVWRWAAGASTVFALGLDGSLQDGGSLFYSLKNGDRGDSLRTNKAERAVNAGVFVDGSIAIAGVWSLSAGLRLDRLHYRSSVFPAGATLSTRIEELTFEQLTPHLGLSFRIDERQTTFASFTGGLEVPAFNEVDPPPGVGASDLNPLLKPMSSSTAEIGYRFQGEILTGGSITTSAAVFLITVRNEIVPFNNGAWFLSAGRSRRVGAELAATFQSEMGMEAMLSWTTMRGSYLDFHSSVGTFSGNEVPGIPRHTLAVRIRYEGILGLSLEGGGRWVGSMAMDDGNSLRLPSSASVDAALGWSTIIFGTTLSARLDVRNLFDTRFDAGGFINPVSRTPAPPISGPAAPAYREPGLPRNLLMTIVIQS